MTVSVQPAEGEVIPALSNSTLLLSNRHSIDVIVEGVSPGGRVLYFLFSFFLPFELDWLNEQSFMHSWDDHDGEQGWDR